MAITMKMARVGANLKQQEVAEKMGVHVQTYAKMESNPGDVTIDQAKLFSQIVGVNWVDIFFHDNSN